MMSFDLCERPLVSQRNILSSIWNQQNHFRGILLWVGILVAAINLIPPAQAQTWLSVTASSTTAGAATVTWTTAVPSDSQVEYGPTAAYGNFSALASTRITAHSVALSGLTAGTTYHFRVRSSDATGVLVTGADNILTTASAITISVTPLTANLAASGTQQFTAKVSNTPNTAVVWSAKGGTVTSSGLFTATAGATTGSVTAASQADPTKSASATLQIGAGQTSSTMMFGDSTIESMVNSMPSGTAEGYQITALSTGTLNTLSVYADATTTATTLFVGLYSDNNGHPGTLLTSSSTAKFQKAAWNTVPVAPVAINAGSKYWLSLLGTGGSLRFRQKQGPGGWVDELNSVSTLTSLPAKWTSGTVYSGGALTSIYGSGVIADITMIPPPATTPVLAVNATAMSFTAQAGTSVSPGGISVTNTGTGTLTFTGSSDQSWLGVSPASGTAPATLAVSPSMSGLKAGTYTGHVTVTGGGTTNAVTVMLTVTAIPMAHSVALSWKTGAANVVSYSLYRSTIAGSSYGLTASAIGGIAYSDQSVQPATTYYYVLTAVDDQGRESAYSNEIRAIIP
jgi:Purple acid Phosphatase, N-terminal domain/Viral BACON domain